MKWKPCKRDILISKQFLKSVNTKMEKMSVVEEKEKEKKSNDHHYHHNNPFLLSSYLRIAKQLIQQANVYREEGNIIDLSTILHRYCRLVAKIPQHSSYSTYSAKEKLHHEKIHQEFVKELEALKSQLCHDSRTPKDQRLQSANEAMCDGAAETKSPSVKVEVNCVTQSSPSQVLTYIQSVPEVSHVSYIASDSSNGHSQSSCHDVHISVRLMDDFLELARDNTNKDLETCGLLGGFLKKGVFYVTTLIIPKQEATSSSCQALNEEEIYAIQSEHSLFPLGWIHTHPSQTCFMSSIDLHTQYCYQIMLPEAVAIVMAPKDSTRRYGIFRITDPGGSSVLKECEERGFHTHQEPSDGSPLYEECSNVYFNPNLRFEIFDLR